MTRTTSSSGGSAPDGLRPIAVQPGGTSSGASSRLTDEAVQLTKPVLLTKPWRGLAQSGRTERQAGLTEDAMRHCVDHPRSFDFAHVTWLL